MSAGRGRRGSWWTVRLDDNDGDGWREYDDSVPVVATERERVAALISGLDDP
ncbi:hypothetical protein [Streptomyces sp. TLI_053]|uniref:hypothetical protein n=1 Tax=Streptomyces sp. TLI_053 TaxID=1855352 RepID=UPI0013520801|nr:hypothetical protein [Streptomyces sp. TLI_053]